MYIFFQAVLIFDKIKYHTNTSSKRGELNKTAQRTISINKITDVR